MTQVWEPSAKVWHSPAAGAAAPPEPTAAEVATATAPPAGMLASLLKPEDTSEPDAKWEHGVQLHELLSDKPVLFLYGRQVEGYIAKQTSILILLTYFF